MSDIRIARMLEASLFVTVAALAHVLARAAVGYDRPWETLAVFIVLYVGLLGCTITFIRSQWRVQ